MTRIVDFVKDVYHEMTKVVWPSRETTIKMTVYVIGLSLFTALLLGSVDHLLNLVIERFFL